MSTQIKKAVVTGGAGFIGSHLVEELIKQGCEVHVIDNLASNPREQVPEGAVFHELDVLNTTAITPIFKDAQVVFHEAALPRVQFTVDFPIESNQVNVDGTLSVLVAARDAGVGRVVYAASASAYGNQTILPYREDMLASPVNPYGLQKYIGEQYLKLFSDVYGLSTVSLRYFNVYGPRMDPSGPYGLAVAKFLEQRKQGKPLTIVGDGTQTRDFVHVYDIVRANILAATNEKVGKGEVINIGTNRNITVNFLADLIGGAERTTLEPRAEAHDSLADNTKAKSLLGWEPIVTLEEGIRELKKEWGIV